MPGRGVSSRTVDYDKPRFARTQSFLQLQALWYGKARKSGFVDIERGRDTNKEKAYDADGVRVSRILHFQPDPDEVDVEAMMEANVRTFGTYTNLADHPTAIAWRTLSKAAHDLPLDYRNRVFLIDLAQVGCVAGYLLRRHRLTSRLALLTFARFLEDIGLSKYQGLLVKGPTVDDMSEEDRTAEAWRELGRAAQEMRHAPRLRLFVMGVCEAGGLTADVLRAHGFGPDHGRRVFKWFLKDNGLGRYARLVTLRAS